MTALKWRTSRGSNFLGDFLVGVRLGGVGVAGAGLWPGGGAKPLGMGKEQYAKPCCRTPDTDRKHREKNDKSPHLTPSSFRP